MIAQIGWRQTFLVYGLVALVVLIPIVWLFVVNRPEDLGQHPDGDPAPPPDPDPPEPLLPLAPGDQVTDHPTHIDWSARSALRTRNFWAISLAVALSFCANGAVLTHIIPHATDIGYEPQAAARVLALIAAMGVMGKLLFGWVTDRVDQRLALIACAALQLSGTATFLASQSYAWLLIGGAVFGLGMGGLVPLQGAMLGAAFGRHSFGRVMGVMSLCMLPIQMIGVPLAGWIYDVTGSYDRAFQLFLGLYALAALVIVPLRLPPGGVNDR
jgi:predicted MFS family arabinose efflux permease